MSPPPFGPISRRNLIRNLQSLGFEGPFGGSKPQIYYRAATKTRINIPNPHGGDIGRHLLARVLRQAGVSREAWEKL